MIYYYDPDNILMIMLNALFDLRCSYYAGCKAFMLLSFLWGARLHLDFLWVWTQEQLDMQHQHI